jgi:hypothetical protein
MARGIIERGQRQVLVSFAALPRWRLGAVGKLPGVNGRLLEPPLACGAMACRALASGGSRLAMAMAMASQTSAWGSPEPSRARVRFPSSWTLELTRGYLQNCRGVCAYIIQVRVLFAYIRIRDPN